MFASSVRGALNGAPQFPLIAENPRMIGLFFKMSNDDHHSRCVMLKVKGPDRWIEGQTDGWMLGDYTKPFRGTIILKNERRS